MVVLRRADPADAAEVARILAAAFVGFEKQYTPAAYRATVPSEHEIAKRCGDGPTWIVWVGEHARGTVSAVVTDSGVYIRSMAVDPAAQGQGIGRLLMEGVQDFARSQGAARMYLSTTPFLYAAIRLYEKQGFRKCDSGPHDLFGTPLLSMERLQS